MMIKPMSVEEIEECVGLIRSSFQTIADSFGFTEENAPRFTAFATTKERLQWQYSCEKRPMFVAVNELGNIIGYYSLQKQSDEACELNNLCVAPECRHMQLGKQLFEHAVMQAKQDGFQVMNIGIVEENKQLRSWYEELGAVHIRTKKFDFFPFTCGYMKLEL